MSEIVIKCEHLTKRLTGEVPVTLVENISLEIKKGEFAVITGPSGSGKSSLLYLLGLLDMPTSGKLWLSGAETSEYDQDHLAAIRLSEIGFVFQFHFLLPEFTALENVVLPMQRLNKLKPEQITAHGKELLANLGLADQSHKLPHQLSGGQQQRVAIARALANNPPVIFADEPTGNLDTASSANVQSILRELAHSGEHTVVAVTHDTAFAAKADRTFVLVDGKLQN